MLVLVLVRCLGHTDMALSMCVEHVLCMDVVHYYGCVCMRELRVKHRISVVGYWFLFMCCCRWRIETGLRSSFSHLKRQNETKRGWLKWRGTRRRDIHSLFVWLQSPLSILYCRMCHTMMVRFSLAVDSAWAMHFDWVRVLYVLVCSACANREKTICVCVWVCAAALVCKFGKTSDRNDMDGRQSRLYHAHNTIHKMYVRPMNPYKCATAL